MSHQQHVLTGRQLRTFAGLLLLLLRCLLLGIAAGRGAAAAAAGGASLMRVQTADKQHGWCYMLCICAGKMSGMQS
jgi:hypothetical protein